MDPSSKPAARLAPGIRLAITCSLVCLGLVLFATQTTSAEESGETFVTVLRPGDNLVGWVGQAKPVESLFEDVPEIEHVWAWDAADRRWRFAAPSVPSRMWTLRTLKPGMGLRVRIGGQKPVEWTRDRRPAQGTVVLNPGYNLVAWMGGDAVPLNHAVKGVGQSLSQALVWSANDGEWVGLASDSLADFAGPPALGFGDAIWVEVDRAVRWLQPTGVIPKLTSERVSDRSLSSLRASLQEVLDFYEDRFGMQADASVLSIHVDLGMYTFHRSDTDQIVLSSRLVRAGARCDILGILVHEYAHALQDQLSNNNHHVPPQWLIEGTAEWAVRAWALHPDNSCRSRHSRAIQAPSRNELARLPSLATVRVAPDNHFTSDAYRLGQIASVRLDERPEGTSPFEFYRMIFGQTEPLPTQLGVPSYERSFVDAFGISLADWYAEFGEWRNDRNGPPNDRRPSGRRTIRGQVMLEDGTVVPNVWVWPMDIETPTYPGSSTAEDGRFEVFVPRGAEYRLYVTFADRDDCGAWYAGDSVAAERSSATVIPVGSRDPQPVTIVLPSNECGQVRGRLLDSAGNGISGATVSTGNALRGDPGTRTLSDGHFEFPLLLGDTHRLNAEIEGCRIYYASDGATFDQRQATVLEITPGDAVELVWNVPAGVCAYRVEGRLVDSDGAPQSDIRVYVQGTSSASGVTDQQGSFSLLLPTTGSFRLLTLVDGCSVYFDGERSTDSNREAAILDVYDGHLTDLTFGVGEGSYCTATISGQLRDAHGRAIAETNVVARNPAMDLSSGRTDANGSFTIKLPPGDGFRVWARIDGCNWYFQSGDAVTSWQEASIVDVEAKEVIDIDFRVSADSCP